jgi:hypothetical protein
MIVISCLVFAAVVGTVCYWLGRAARLNHAIRTNPDEVLYNVDTGEVLEPGTAAHAYALQYGKIKKLSEPKKSKVKFES